MTKTKAFFFDRDGIVNQRIMCGYVTTPDEFIFFDDFFTLFRAVKQAGFLAILITNQQGIGKGLMTDDDLRQIHRMMQAELIARSGSGFDDIYYCGELSSSSTSRRKPSPAMLLEAIEKHDIDPAPSWLIGDSVSDTTAGKRAGVRTILIGAEHQGKDIADADYVFNSLGEYLQSPLWQSIVYGELRNINES